MRDPQGDVLFYGLFICLICLGYAIAMVGYING